MPATGFVLITTKASKEIDVFKELSEVKQITELHALFGEYDLIAKIEAADFDELGTIVTNNIRTCEGIVDTKTLAGARF